MAHSDILSLIKELFTKVNAKFKENYPRSSHKEELLLPLGLKKVAV